MKQPIIDHLWTKIAEDDYIGRIAIEQKLEQVALLSGAIADAEGVDVLNNVMDSGLIAVALSRCKQFHDRDPRVTSDDLHINYRYATFAMRKAQDVIDEELPHLGL